MSMTPEIAAKLRAPFPAEVVGKLPRIICPKCRDARSKACDEHAKSKCRDCGNYITPRHIHLDYVGHAETTDRLLQADPEWAWEPMAFGEDGLPAMDRNGGLWIRLTVAGVTRIGYGHADGKTGADAIKEAIGDAIRNAAMRFGVALDLWGAHGPAEPEQESRPLASAKSAQDAPPPADTPQAARAALATRVKALNVPIERVAVAYQRMNGTDIGQETDPRKIRAFSDQLVAGPEHVLGNGHAKAGVS